MDLTMMGRNTCCEMRGQTPREGKRTGTKVVCVCLFFSLHFPGYRKVWTCLKAERNEGIRNREKIRVGLGGGDSLGQAEGPFLPK